MSTCMQDWGWGQVHPCMLSVQVQWQGYFWLLNDSPKSRVWNSLIKLTEWNLLQCNQFTSLWRLVGRGYLGSWGNLCKDSLNQALNLDVLGLQYYSMSPLSNSPEDVVALHHTYTHTYTYTHTGLTIDRYVSISMVWQRRTSWRLPVTS